MEELFCVLKFTTWRIAFSRKSFHNSTSFLTHSKVFLNTKAPYQNEWLCTPRTILLPSDPIYWFHPKERYTTHMTHNSLVKTKANKWWGKSWVGSFMRNWWKFSYYNEKIVSVHIEIRALQVLSASHPYTLFLISFFVPPASISQNSTDTQQRVKKTN